MTFPSHEEDYFIITISCFQCDSSYNHSFPSPYRYGRLLRQAKRARKKTRGGMYTEAAANTATGASAAALKAVSGVAHPDLVRLCALHAIPVTAMSKGKEVARQKEALTRSFAEKLCGPGSADARVWVERLKSVKEAVGILPVRSKPLSRFLRKAGLKPWGSDAVSSASHDVRVRFALTQWGRILPILREKGQQLQPRERLGRLDAPTLFALLAKAGLKVEAGETKRDLSALLLRNWTEQLSGHVEAVEETLGLKARTFPDTISPSVVDTITELYRRVKTAPAALKEEKGQGEDGKGCEDGEEAVDAVDAVEEEEEEEEEVEVGDEADPEANDVGAARIALLNEHCFPLGLHASPGCGRQKDGVLHASESTHEGGWASLNWFLGECGIQFLTFREMQVLQHEVNPESFHWTGKFTLATMQRAIEQHTSGLRNNGYRLLPVSKKNTFVDDPQSISSPALFFFNRQTLHWMVAFPLKDTVATLQKLTPAQLHAYPRETLYWVVHDTDTAKRAIAAGDLDRESHAYEVFKLVPKGVLPTTKAQFFGTRPRRTFPVAVKSRSVVRSGPTVRKRKRFGGTEVIDLSQVPETPRDKKGRLGHGRYDTAQLSDESYIPATSQRHLIPETLLYFSKYHHLPVTDTVQEGDGFFLSLLRFNRFSAYQSVRALRESAFGDATNMKHDLEVYLMKIHKDTLASVFEEKGEKNLPVHERHQSLVHWRKSMCKAAEDEKVTQRGGSFALHFFVNVHQIRLRIITQNKEGKPRVRELRPRTWCEKAKNWEAGSTASLPTIFLYQYRQDTQTNFYSLHLPTERDFSRASSVFYRIQNMGPNVENAQEQMEQEDMRRKAVPMALPCPGPRRPHVPDKGIDNPASRHDTLTQRLLLFSLSTVNVPGDGNCLFHAFHECLTGNPRGGASLREEAVNFVTAMAASLSCREVQPEVEAVRMWGNLPYHPCQPLDDGSEPYVLTRLRTRRYAEDDEISVLSTMKNVLITVVTNMIYPGNHDDFASGFNSYVPLSYNFTSIDTTLQDFPPDRRVTLANLGQAGVGDHFMWIKGTQANLEATHRKGLRSVSTRAGT